MAIAVVASANNSGGSSSPQTFSFTTIAGADSILIVTMTGGCIPTSMTWDGTAMTKGPAIEGINGNNAGAVIYYLLNPAVGTYDIVCTFTAPVGACHIGAVQATGVAQQAPEDSQTTSTIWGNSLTTPACSHSAGALVVTNGNINNAGAFSSLGIVGGSDTLLFNKDNATGGGRCVGSSWIIPPTAGTKQSTYQKGSNGTMAAAIAAFAPAGAASFVPNNFLTF
jgi:hypothetical protein